MKLKTTILKIFRTTFCFAFALFISAFLSSCSKKMSFHVSSIVPAATGYVKVSKKKGENYTLRMNVLHLSSPDRLRDSKDAYVLWMNTETNGVKNLGQVSSSSGLFSKALKSELRTQTPFTPLSFFITAENDPAISFPRGQVILTTE